MNESLNSRLRSLPAISQLLTTSQAADLIAQYGHPQVVKCLQQVIDAERRALLAGDVQTPSDDDALLQQAAHLLAKTAVHTLRPVINATGVIIHTNLGRAPLSDDARAAVNAVAKAYNTLEFDLDTGKRGSRNVHAESLIPEIIGAEAALVVNNAASALLLTLSGLATGREVIVSRGQLIEIGGGFRIPEIMVQGGARLVEVGTTNKTRPADYRRAITADTGLLLRVHASNFKQMGFTQSVSLAEMAAIAHEHGLPLADDVGSGALLDPAQFGLAPEPLVQDSIAAGADVVLFSGDKLLGGPQAGIIVGKREAVDRLKTHPLSRAIRADKMALAALAATLEHYRRGEAVQKVPIWWMMSREQDELHRTAERWAKQFPGAFTQDGSSTVGGGSVPGSTLPTRLLVLDVPRADDFVAHLRGASLPVIARIADDRVLFDPRTVFPDQEETLLAAIDGVLSSRSDA